MESSVDPPYFNDIDIPAINTVSMPNLSDEQTVVVIQDQILTENEPSTSSDLRSPRPLSVLAAEATLAVMKAYQMEELQRQQLVSTTGDPVLTSQVSLVDILVDRPRQNKQHKNKFGIRRSSSAFELMYYHDKLAPTSPAMPRKRLKSFRPGLSTKKSRFQLPIITATEMQSHLSVTNIVPPLEPSRRSRLLITYNYSDNRFRVLRFSMETRNVQRRTWRHPFFPRAVLNQIQRIGGRHRTHHHSSARRPLLNSGARGALQERLRGFHHPQQRPIPSTRRFHVDESSTSSDTDLLSTITSAGQTSTTPPPTSLESSMVSLTTTPGSSNSSTFGSVSNSRPPTPPPIPD